VDECQRLRALRRKAGSSSAPWGVLAFDSRIGPTPAASQLRRARVPIPCSPWRTRRHSQSHFSRSASPGPRWPRLRPGSRCGSCAPASRRAAASGNSSSRAPASRRAAASGNSSSRGWHERSPALRDRAALPAHWHQRRWRPAKQRRGPRRDARRRPRGECVVQCDAGHHHRRRARPGAARESCRWASTGRASHGLAAGQRRARQDRADSSATGPRASCWWRSTCCSAQVVQGPGFSSPATNELRPACPRAWSP
jgi:hypothetical protein